VKIDDQLRSSVDGIWAAGDVRGGPAFTDTAYDDFRGLCSPISLATAATSGASEEFPFRR
jgi:pyruvate/2-oxoglutarate dehydrogenase complex dihydrolipoamide dehydrogenase (E3) component